MQKYEFRQDLVTEDEWKEATSKYNLVIQYNSQGYIIREFKRCETDWKFYYLFPKDKTFSHCTIERCGDKIGMVEEHEGIRTSIYHNYAEFRMRTYGLYGFIRDGKCILREGEKSDEEELSHYSDIEKFKKVLDKYVKVVENWELPNDVKQLLINKLKGG
jgi:hypothetical protein